MAEINFEDRLFKIFANVNDWLKFSEAKNAMIIAFNAASIYGIFKANDISFVKNSDYLITYLIMVVILLVFSTICSLASFAPRLKLLPEGWYGSSNNSNVLFFEYLKTRTHVEILKEVSGKNDEDEFTKFERDLAEQIRQNSIIVSRKFSYFTVAVWITIAAYITIPFALIICLYTYLRK